jgi:hypothetical protein
VIENKPCSISIACYISIADYDHPPGRNNMVQPEIVIRAKVKGAAAIYLSALRDGTQDLQAFVADLENGIKHRAPFDTAARALAIAIFRVEWANTPGIKH